MSNTEDALLDAMLYSIGDHFSERGEWGSKYGVNIDSDVFTMRKYCWCDTEECKRCSGEEPNFHYKPLDYKVTWYKYIGRGMTENKQLTAIQQAEMFLACLKTNVNLL